jgi:hypothetical protein
MCLVNKTGLNVKQLHEGKQGMFSFKGRNFIYIFVTVFQRTSVRNNSIQFNTLFIYVLSLIVNGQLQSQHEYKEITIIIIIIK